MSIYARSATQTQASLLIPILLGGALAGTLDQIAAFVSSGLNVPRVVAAGLFGPQIIHGSSAAYWMLGVGLHFFIAFSAAAIYCVASRKFHFLERHPVVCGPFFGIGVFVMMYLVVMPLSALHFKGPYSLAILRQAVAVHMLLIGLPIGVVRGRW